MRHASSELQTLLERIFFDARELSQFSRTYLSF